MKYRNTKTGAVVEVGSEISGDWEPITEEKAKEPTTKARKSKKKEAEVNE